MTGEEARRPLPARIGIAALNLVAPGLGLLRLAEPRRALFWWLLATVPLLLEIVIWAASPVLAFRPLMFCVGVIVVASLAAVVGSIAASWRCSRPAAPGSPPAWSRWYAILLAAIAAVAAAQLLVAAAHHFYKPFYIPSEAMMPTLLENDRLVASMRVPTTFRRGDVILFRVGKAVYLKRLAALPGDRIAMVGGRVVLNGRSVPQQAIGTDRLEGMAEEPNATRLREHFPGEAGDHFIYDSGPSAGDDYAEIRVPAGHLFVLGDNRDFSADSRFPTEEGAFSLLPIADVLGTALFYTWGPSHKSGQPIR